MYHRLAALAALVVVGVSCMGPIRVPPPTPRTIQSSFPIARPFDAVWQATTEVFAELNLPILNVEKASGLITTDWISFRGQSNEAGYCDCGQTRFPLGEVDRQGRFNVYVKRIGEDACELMVNSVFEKVARYQEVVERTACVSTGNLEATMHQRVMEKLQ